MFPKILAIGLLLLVGWVCPAQESAPSQPPQVKVHMLNVCSPSSDEQKEISGALARIPNRPSFSPDFEVDRGRSSLDPRAGMLAGVSPAQLSAGDASADFVRIRRELASDAAYLNVQYSFSRDTKQMVETLVFRVRDPKDVLQVSIEDSASSVTSPSSMLRASTPASRIKLERFGKSSVVLARCFGQQGSPAPDQSAYEPLFGSASTVLSNYRNLLGAKTLVPEELARINIHRRAGPAARKAAAEGHN